MEYLFIKTEQFIKVNGQMISSTDQELKVGLMDLNIKDNTSMAKNMEMVIMNGLMDQISTEIGFKINIQVLVLIIGLMEENIKVNGLMEKCMESVFIKKTIGYIQENSDMIKNKDMEFKNQIQEKFIMELG